ncbi:MAG TPA: phosphoribosylamine--glycine ligase [Actinomycetota bacterium]|nr:phosphoribosylamine--glycine ligase [Actinomycetota bacterium]
MRVLVVGSGGREHALAWRLASSPSVDDVHAAPGNVGIASLGECHAAAADDVAAMVKLIDQLDADLTVIGPEAPLVAGLADELDAAGRRVFGVSADAARLEGSKAFAKEVMVRHGIPTARAGTFDEVDPAVAFVDALGGRAVVKADGLAAGKGVVVAERRDEAVAAIEASLVGRAFGEAGARVVVEELLEGPEVSAFAVSDGTTVVPLALSQDFKRVGDGDTGPNTGGMGAYSPLPWIDAEDERAIWDDVVKPTIMAMAADGTPYRGVLFAGLMLTADGPKTLEYNCRFGDPETEALMPRLDGDLGELLAACADGDLSTVRPVFRDEAAVTVVLASGGYPGSYGTGFPIEGIDDAERVDGVTVFHAGTALRDGTVVTAGGRVLAVSATGSTLAEARHRAELACDRVSFEGMHRRRDIAARAAGEEAET